MAPSEHKRLATLQACAALAGFAVQISDDDRGNPLYVITRGAMCERVIGLDELERWLEAVGAVEVTA